MRAWVAYRTFRTSDRDVRFYTVRNVLGSDSNFNGNNVYTRGGQTTARGHLQKDEPCTLVKSHGK